MDPILYMALMCLAGAGLTVGASWVVDRLDRR
jgi:hypothetical protein